MISRCTAASERRCGPPVPPPDAYRAAGGALDGSRRLVEGAAGGLDRGQPAQPVGMFLLRQRATGDRLGKRQVAELAARTAVDFDDFYATRKLPPAADPGDVLAPEGAAVVVTRHREHRFPGRRRPVQVRFGEEEFAAIELAAGRAGLTPTGYVGAVALAAARGAVPPAPSQSREALTELMAARAQVRRFGGNVNQAVAALNSTGETPQWLAQAVELTSRAVRQVDAAAEALMRRRA